MMEESSRKTPKSKLLKKCRQHIGNTEHLEIRWSKLCVASVTTVQSLVQ